MKLILIRFSRDAFSFSTWLSMIVFVKTNEEAIEIITDKLKEFEITPKKRELEIEVLSENLQTGFSYITSQGSN